MSHETAPPQTPAYTPPPKKRSAWKWLLGIGLAVLMLCGGIAAIIAVVGANAVNEATKDKTVVLEVTGPAQADVTYGTGSDQSQDNGATLPWRKELTSKDAVLVAVVTAQNKGSGEIACKITVDGKVVKENKSSGEFAVVTCSNS